MLSCKTCDKVPLRGGRGAWDCGGGLVEVEGGVVWGGYEGSYVWGGAYGEGYGGVYLFNEVEFEWSRVAGGVEEGGTLAGCGGRLVWVGGLKNGVWSKEVMELRGGRWSLMSNMLEGCRRSCVLSITGGGMVVMGGDGDGLRRLNDVQVFDDETQTWHRGPSLPLPCDSMSAIVHGDLVFMMGGYGMARAVWCADICDLVSH